MPQPVEISKSKMVALIEEKQEISTRDLKAFGVEFTPDVRASFWADFFKIFWVGLPDPIVLVEDVN